MALPEIVDDKEGIFKRPHTKRDILRERRVIRVDRFEDIIPAHEARRANEAVVVGPGVEFYDEHQFYSPQNFSKRGPIAWLNTFDGDTRELVRNEWSDLKARIDASERYHDDPARHIGWGWHDPEGIVHVVRPSMVVEGHRLHMFALRSKKIGDKISFPKDEEYSAGDSHLKTVSVNVPSRTGKPYNILIEHVTDLDDPQRFVEWTRTLVRHDCPFIHNDFTFRWPRVVTYDPHGIAAHAAYSRRVGEEKKRVIPQPFPLFTEPLLRLHLSLVYDTAHLRMDEHGKTWFQALPFPAIDTVLMEAWKTIGNKGTFYAHAPTKTYMTADGQERRHKRMREYNWSNSDAGMPFRRA